jgi:hypothetical protein
LAVIVAFLIGLSRVYLVEHYVSDLLNGYLVGGRWLILGIACCEWHRPANHATASPRQRARASAFVAMAVGAALYISLTSVSPLNDFQGHRTQVIAYPMTLLTQTNLPHMTEVLTGVPRQPVNLIVTAPDAASLTKALAPEGWQAVARPELGRLAQAFLDDWMGRALPNSLVIPTFWDNRPRQFGFAKPAAPPFNDQRLHIWFWDSLVRSVDGQTVFIGTLTEEDPLRWTWQHQLRHPAGPHVPATLSGVVATLHQAGLGATAPYVLNSTAAL